MRVITSTEFAKALEAAGIVDLSKGDVERIVIDVSAEELIKVHVQHTGDERLISAVEMLGSKVDS